MTPQDATVITFYTVISSAWLALTSDGATPWLWSFYGVFTYVLIQSKETDEKKVSRKQLFAFFSIGTVFGVWLAGALASKSDAVIFPFITAIIGCIIIKLALDKDMQAAVKMKALSLVKKGKLP
jgi:predicted MFS family arabinose efflux permease